MPRVLRLLALALALGAVLSLEPGAGRGQTVSAHDPLGLPKGCGSCHVGHGKRRSQMLPALEEQLCYRCHGGGQGRLEEQGRGRLGQVTRLRDVSADFRLPFRHPVEWSGRHQPGERLPETDPRAPRHVECVDCHRAHRTARVGLSSTRAQIGRRSSLDGRTPEHELCYRCHSTSLNLPRTTTNIQRRFALGNPSYHPVESVGRGKHVPSLRAPLNTASVISCGDCHGNDSGRGVHGSRYEFLLRRHYSAADNTPESPFAYALCYDCHDRQTLFSGKGFSEHERHVRQARASCAVCHDPHGSFSSPHLVEFDPAVVKRDTVTGRLAYLARGPGYGQCFLTCHGVVHTGREYCEPGTGCSRTGTTTQQRRPLLKRMRRSPFSF